jgi:hypothetical protein
MSYSCSDFAMDVENLCRAHGFTGGDLEALHIFLRERIPPKSQQVYAWMTESFERGRWMTGFVGAMFPGFQQHMPLVMRNPVIARSMGKELALNHGVERNQTTWFRTFTHYIDEDAIYLRPEGTMPK